MNCKIIAVPCGTKHDLPFWSSRGLYLVRLGILGMDASGDQSEEQQAAEKPIGVEEQRTIESQEAQAEEERSTEDVEPSPTTTEEIIGKAQEKEQNEFNRKQDVNEKPKPRDAPTKLFDQFTKHFQVSKVASGTTTNMLKQIQKQLNQIDRTTANSNKQQIIIKQLVAQVKVMQKQLDKIGSSVSKFKNIPNIKGKKDNIKRKKK